MKPQVINRAELYRDEPKLQLDAQNTW